MAGLKLTDALWNIWHIMKIKNEANIVSMTWYLYKYITFIIYIVFEKKRQDYVYGKDSAWQKQNTICDVKIRQI